MREGPWTGRYPAAAAMVIFALVPYLALSAALQPITPIIQQVVGSNVVITAYAVYRAEYSN